MTSSMPASAAIARATVSLSPVSSTGRSPRDLIRVIASALVSLIVSATTRIARASPSQPTATAVRPCGLGGLSGALQLGGQVLGPLGQQARTAGQDRVPVDDALDAEPLDVREVLHGRQAADPLDGALGDGLGDRVLGGVLQRPGESQHLVGVLAVGGDDVGQGHPAGGDGAGLVQHDRVDPAGGLQDLRALDEDAELGAAARTDQEGGGRGQAEGARAGDDEHRDGRGERRCGTASGAEPEPEGGHRQSDHDRHEDPGDPVGEALHLRLAALGLLHQLGHLRELGVRADLGRLDDQAAARVDGGADDGVADPDLDGHGLSGEHAQVDRRAALDHDAVRGDLLAGPYDEAVTGPEPLDGDAFFAAVAQHGDVLGAHLQQRPQRRPGAPLGAGLEVAVSPG